MARLTLNLLGGFQLARDGDAEAPSLGRKGEALLAYLLLNTESAHGRGKLAALLWCDRGDEEARHGLRQCPSAVRKALPDADSPILKTEGEELAIDCEVLDVDVLRFEKLADENGADESHAAMELYKGELLQVWMRGRRNLRIGWRASGGGCPTLPFVS